LKRNLKIHIKIVFLIGKYFLYTIGGIGLLGGLAFFGMKGVTRLQMKALSAAMKGEELQLTFMDRLIGTVGGYLAHMGKRKVVKEILNHSEVFMLLNKELAILMKENSSLELPHRFYLLFDMYSYETEEIIDEPEMPEITSFKQKLPEITTFEKIDFNFFVSSSLLTPMEGGASQTNSKDDHPPPKKGSEGVERGGNLSASQLDFRDLLFDPHHPLATQTLSHQVQVTLHLFKDKKSEQKKVVIQKCAVRDVLGTPNVANFAGPLQKILDDHFGHRVVVGESPNQSEDGSEQKQKEEVIIDAEYEEKKP